MNQPHITAEEIPANFVMLEEKIIALKNTHPMPPVLTFEAYKKMAEACNLEKEDDILQASEFLYSLGQIVYFFESFYLPFTFHCSLLNTEHAFTFDVVLISTIRFKLGLF
jgi:hypothetical protein